MNCILDISNVLAKAKAEYNYMRIVKSTERES